MNQKEFNVIVEEWWSRHHHTFAGWHTLFWDEKERLKVEAAPGFDVPAVHAWFMRHFGGAARGTWGAGYELMRPAVDALKRTLEKVEPAASDDSKHVVTTEEGTNLA